MDQWIMIGDFIKEKISRMNVQMQKDYASQIEKALEEQGLPLDWSDIDTMTDLQKYHLLYKSITAYSCWIEINYKQLDEAYKSIIKRELTDSEFFTQPFVLELLHSVLDQAWTNGLITRYLEIREIYKELNKLYDDNVRIAYFCVITHLETFSRQKYMFENDIDVEQYTEEMMVKYNFEDYQKDKIKFYLHGRKFKFDSTLKTSNQKIEVMLAMKEIVMNKVEFENVKFDFRYSLLLGILPNLQQISEYEDYKPLEDFIEFFKDRIIDVFGDIETSHTTWAYFSYLDIKRFYHKKKLNDEEVKLLNSESEEILKNLNQEPYVKLENELTMIYRKNLIDEDSVDPIKLIEIKHEFSKVMDILNDESQHYILGYWKVICVLWSLKRLNSLQIITDSEIAIKALDLFKDQKYTYIRLLERALGRFSYDLIPYMEIALKYASELGLHELEENVVSIKRFLVYEYMIEKSQISLSKAEQILIPLIETVEKGDWQWFHQMQIKLYQFAIAIYFDKNEIHRVQEFWLRYLEFALWTEIDKYSYISVLEQALAYCFMYKDNGNFIKFAPKSIEYMRKKIPNTKEYTGVLSKMYSLMVLFRYHNFCHSVHNEVDKLILKHYGENSIEYIEFMISYSGLSIQEGQLNLSYDTSMKNYERSAKLFGTEKNSTNIDIMLNMIQAKYLLKQYQESLDLIEKNEQMELEIGSSTSNAYLTIQNFRVQVEAEIVALKKAEQRGILAKLKPNTTFKIVAYTIGIIAVAASGVYYYKKGQKPK